MGMVAMNSKFQIATGVAKYSFLANMNEYLAGLKVAGDATCNVKVRILMVALR